MAEADWQAAKRLGARIRDEINAVIDDTRHTGDAGSAGPGVLPQSAPRSTSAIALTGMMLALDSLLYTIPRDAEPPESLARLRRAQSECLDELLVVIRRL